MYLIPAEGFGGAERQALLHIRNLPAYGIEVIAVTGPGKIVLDQLSGTGDSVHYCPYLPSEYGRPFQFVAFFRHLGGVAVSWIRTLQFLVDLNKQERVDLVFASRVVGWSLAAPLSLWFGIPCVWRFGSRVQGWFRRAALKGLGIVFKPAAVVSNCKSVSESVKGIVDAPLYTVANGIDCRRYNASAATFSLREKIGLHPAAPVVGLAVRPSPDKGMDFLAEIVKHVERIGSAAHFCIAGEFGWRERIEEDFEKKGIAAKITFLGHIGDMISFYSGCDIVALTSRDRSIEGFPNALLEAMALGRPVIATPVGGVPELVEHDETGILVKSPDPAVFAREIMRLLENPEKRAQLGSAARKAVLERYSVEFTVGLLSKNIASVLATARGYVPVPELSTST